MTAQQPNPNIHDPFLLSLRLKLNCMMVLKSYKRFIKRSPFDSLYVNVVLDFGLFSFFIYPLMILRALFILGLATLMHKKFVYALNC